MHFKLSTEDEAHIKRHLKRIGRCEIELVSVVTEDQGFPVAELMAQYHIIRLRKQSTESPSGG